MLAESSAACVAALCLALACTGCTSPYKTLVRRDSAAGLYERAEVAYRLDASRLSLPLTLAHVEGQLVSYDYAPSNPAPGQSTATLKLIYPHPSGRTELALARVEIESTVPAGENAPSGGAVGETWELDITRGELDRIVSRLNHAGYFDRNARRGEGVRIVSTLDGESVEKEWEQSAELDQLMVRVRGQGQLVGLERPAGFRPHGAPPASVVAWRDLAARRLAATGAPQQPQEGELGRSLTSAVHHGLADPALAGPAQISRLPQVEPQRR